MERTLGLGMSERSGKIDDYQYALIEQTGLIAIRRPDGSFKMLPGTNDIKAAVRNFIELDSKPSSSEH
tara:strand:+ start:11417 stop:11620 length:204 start_codon:yes stop_codon:yes gene_type:complete